MIVVPWTKDRFEEQKQLRLFHYENSTQIAFVDKKGKMLSTGVIALVDPEKGLLVNGFHWKDNGLPVDDKGNPIIKVEWQ